MIAASPEERPVFCDLFSSHASLREYNTSGEVAARPKRAALANVDSLAELLRAYLPELGKQARQVSAQLGFAMSAIWVHRVHPRESRRRQRSVRRWRNIALTSKNRLKQRWPHLSAARSRAARARR